MTNKNKRGSSKAAKATAPTADPVDGSMTKDALNPSSSMTPQSDPKSMMPMRNFTKAQMSILVMLWLGLSKVYESYKAIGQAEDGKTHLCDSWLIDGEGCADDGGLNSLIRLKFHTGLSLAVLVLSVVSLTWTTESLLQRFVSLMVLCPAATMASLLLYHADAPFRFSRVKQQVALCVLMAAVATPGERGGYPFVALGEEGMTRFRKSAFTMQGVTLMVLAGLSIFQVLWKGDLLANLTSGTNAITAISTACRLDHLAMSLVYMYALVHFPNAQQRSFLLSVSVLKMVELFYQLPAMEQSWHDVESTRHVLVGTALLAGVSWMAPSMNDLDEAISGKKTE